MKSGASCTAGGVWTNNLTIPMKENISSLGSDEAVETLQSLNPVKYNYKAEKDQKHVGFIAEEVPDLVAMKDRKSPSPMDIVAVLARVTHGSAEPNPGAAADYPEATGYHRKDGKGNCRTEKN
jgi:hypothetical protein